MRAPGITILAAFLGLSALALCAPPALAKPSPVGIRWAPSFAAALAQAKSSKRMVLVDFYTEWCGYCKKLDAETYPDPRVASAVRSSFVAVRLDAEREGAPQARQFGVHAYPTLLFLDGNGEEEYRIGGYMPPEPFAKALDRIMAVHREVPRLEARLAANPKDANTAATLTVIYTEQHRGGKADAALSRLATLDPRNETGKLSQCDLILGDMYRAKGAVDRAAPLYHRATRLGRNGTEIGYAHLGLAFCSILRNDVPAAVPELNAAAGTPGAPDGVQQAARQVLAQIRQQAGGSGR